MGIKVKLIKSHSGSNERQLRTIFGLGLRKFNQERLLQDTPEIRGMIFKVQHLVSHEIVKEEPKKTVRRKPAHIKNRDARRAREAAAAKK